MIIYRVYYRLENGEKRTLDKFLTIEDAGIYRMRAQQIRWLKGMDMRIDKLFNCGLSNSFIDGQKVFKVRGE